MLDIQWKENVHLICHTGFYFLKIIDKRRWRKGEIWQWKWYLIVQYVDGYVSNFGQRDEIGFGRLKKCSSPYTRQYSNPWYSQCLIGSTQSTSTNVSNNLGMQSSSTLSLSLCMNDRILKIGLIRLVVKLQFVFLLILIIHHVFSKHSHHQMLQVLWTRLLHQLRH